VLAMLANFSLGPAPELADLYGLVVQFLVPAGSTVFYFNPSREMFWEKTLLLFPQIIWRREEIYPGLYDQHGSDIFVMARLSRNSFERQLEVLTSTLTHLRLVRVLVEVTGEDSPLLATQVLSLALKYSMLNVVLYFESWNRILNIYSYRAFPDFKLLKRQISGNRGTTIFHDQLKDLHGYKLRVQMDLSPPNSFLIGGQKVAGFLWKYIETFAGNIGADIERIYPTWQKAKISSADYMVEFARNGSTDIGLTPTMASFKFEERYWLYTYPIMDTEWCTMLPEEIPLRTDTLFEHVLCLESAVLLLMGYLLFFLVVPALVKYLGVHCRWQIWRLISRLFTLILLCACSAQLLSLLIHPPLMPPIRSFDELLTSGLKIFGLRSEFYYLDGGFRAKYASAFHLTDNLSELFNHRNHFNTTWAYTITSIKWQVIEAQQRHFARPLFRFSEELCLQWSSSSSLIIAPESVFRKPLHLYGIRIAQAGLLDHWITHSFYDMVRAGRMVIKDYSVTPPLLPLRIKDLRICWRVCGAGLIISLVVFVLELLLFYTNVLLNSL
ncbi:hypothetical protein KR009_003314, partial [Drosophila setifemur]